ncbi:UV DNA damage repair endonuclease UvsE [Oscillatoria sp. FACHB-1407]|uniref:UV DNA damage repair endonuclease UvsE n=1 Tax=Oscillatoria sp. FACHB-1407 TaxID=2692847 RepID=UPI001685715A|nr:UV DNA damage repair endonuclease UvsE [Oscillatoria sp. FACHB-1407]MBD2460898.1 UV DNA damage repair endonuclease UvsE [Oscillatoria sp. FACHB-1407]
MNESHFKQPELGLVCITASDQVRFKTMTRKRLLQLAPNEQTDALRDLYAQNMKRLDAAITFCEREGVHLYRLISGLFPFADDPIGADVLTEFSEGLAIVGAHAIASGIRLVLHPDQFVVLNSDRPDVIENSIKILTAHARTFDLLGQPQSPWALMNIHGGKGDRAERLVSVIRDLPDTIRLRLTLENDEYAYGANQIAEVCQAAGIPMVFDAHHHAINQHLETYEDPSVAEMLEVAKTTWQNPDWQLVHISNGCESFTDPKHSDYITLMPSSYRYVPWIEIEAKQKERAIAKLREDWLTLGFPSHTTELQPV